MEGASLNLTQNYQVGNSTARYFLTFCLHFPAFKLRGNTFISPTWSHILYEVGLNDSDHLKKSLNLDFLLLYMLFLLIALLNATKTFPKQCFVIFVDKVKNSNQWLVGHWLYFLEMFFTESMSLCLYFMFISTFFKNEVDCKKKLKIFGKPGLLDLMEVLLHFR
jgi:hypothetical protein